MVDATSTEDRGSTPDDPQQFATALDDLKQAGCIVLITGTVDATVRAAMSRRLFGAVSLPRQRVLVHPDDTVLRLASYLPHGLTPTSEDVSAIASAQLRGGSAASATPTSPAEEHDNREPLSVRDTYRQQFDTLFAETESTADTVNAGELRVGVLTLGELLDQYGQSAAQAALTTVGRQMRAQHGIGHCHLPVASESAVATTLAECADIHVRLRERKDYPPEQCWSLRDADCRSAWLPLDLYT